MEETKGVVAEEYDVESLYLRGQLEGRGVRVADSAVMWVPNLLGHGLEVGALNTHRVQCRNSFDNNDVSVAD